MSNVESTISYVGARPASLSQQPPPKDDNITKNAAAQLRSVVERIEAIEAEKQELSNDVKEIYTEAKGNGYDIKALRTIIRLRKMKEGDRAEQEAVLDTYKQALGMLV
jgi:uncharacterized protein (UPF0335 family)